MNLVSASDLWQLGYRTGQQLLRGHKKYKNIHLIHLHNQDKNITWRFDYAVQFLRDREKLGDFSRIYEKIWNDVQCYNLS